MSIGKVKHVVVLVALLMMSAGWSKPEHTAPYQVVANTVATFTDCAMCESQYAGVDDLWYVWYEGDCIEEHEAGCSQCLVDPSECYGTWLFNGDGCSVSCGYTMPEFELREAAASPKDASTLASLLREYPDELRYVRSRESIQLISRCGKVIGNYPLSSSLQKDLDQRLQTAD